MLPCFFEELAGILCCQFIKPVKVVRKGFLTTPEESGASG